ncbi:hypothetical protein EUGRSUZ_A02059 [Eucalyptus grandis]|uniref:Uncharacterized protein n=2 Tax=Eucalyptus grandis TaxID=71139 RepID=A0ACC3M583_EUCGR|nr:hypothetical protein EUGRSUZ_A02059 [Eucalyptus grandis]
MLVLAAEAESPSQSLALPGCQDTCGDLTNIPYPFGIGRGCFLDPLYEIDCQQTPNISTPVLKNFGVVVLKIKLPRSSEFPGLIKVAQPIFYSPPSCTTNQQTDPPLDLTDSHGTFLYSQIQNIFVAGGCHSMAFMVSREMVLGCNSSCDSKSLSCFNDTYCCNTTIPDGIARYSVEFKNLDGKAIATGDDECSYGFLVSRRWWYNTNLSSLLPPAVPVVLEWGVDCASLLLSRNQEGSSGTCDVFRPSHGYCLCYCSEGYSGNFHLPQGCQDIDECKDPEIHCPGMCVNRQGSYNCIKIETIAIIVGGTAIGAIVLLLPSSWFYNKRRRTAKLKQIFFERNGGLLLQQCLSSIEDNHAEKGKLFASSELDTATDHFNENRILGQGGQGTVYKGMLTDGMIIAVKKLKFVDPGQLEQFVNEIVILSQINHRNVVKLLGFCLESEMPLLVYEFIPNGTLYQYLHGPAREFPVSWEVRLRIANEVAGALSYLHFAVAKPVYHRDIKSSNILLDEKYRAKVADFGASRAITIDQTHLTTMVRGTFGYLDPEYYQTSQFTDKSDVYSFGVVLVELLTGEKPISQLRVEEGRNLASYFVISMEENRLFDVLDKEVLDHGEKEEIIAVSNLAKRCLNPNGRYRPTMKEVAMELERVQSLRNPTIVWQNEEEIDHVRTGSIHAPGAIPMLMQSGAEVELTSMEEDQSL